MSGSRKGAKQVEEKDETFLTTLGAKQRMQNIDDQIVRDLSFIPEENENLLLRDFESRESAM